MYATMSRIGQAPIPVPTGVDVTIDGQDITVNGPKGTLSRTIAPTITVSQDDGALSVTRPDDERQNRALHGLTRSLDQQHGRRRHRRLPQAARDRRRRLPGRGPGPGRGAAGPRVQPPGQRHGARRHHVRGAGADAGGRRAASTRKWSARSPPTSAASASPSRTRARASATRARRSCARPARPGRSKSWPTSPRIRRQSRLRRHRRVRKKIHGTAARPRLAVYRSNKHLTVQVIDDEAGVHVGRGLVERGRHRAPPGAAPRWQPPPASARWSPSGRKAAGITKVVFDRGGFLYHGRIAAVAAAARDAGLEF